MLDAAGIDTWTSTHAEVPEHGVVVLRPGGNRIDVDRVVTLAVPRGPRIAGLPHDGDGFLPVDRHCHVRGVDDVYAAGDATNFSVKQGGLACQQADAAADAIAVVAGVPIAPEPFRPVLRGVLLTERGRQWMRRDAGGGGDPGSITAPPLWWPPTKIALPISV